MGKPAVNDHEDFEWQNEAAVREGREADRIEPRASAIRYDAARGLVLVELRSGFAFGFPPERVQGLEAGSAKQLADLRISPSGTPQRVEGRTAAALTGDEEEQEGVMSPPRDEVAQTRGCLTPSAANT